MGELDSRAVREHSRSSWVGDSVAAVVLVVAFWVPQLLSASEVWLSAAGAALALVAAVSVMVRWRLPSIAPVAALVATGGAWFLQVSSDPMLAVAWCLYPLALRRGRRSRIIGGAAVVVMIFVSLTYGAAPSAAGVGQRIIFAAVAIGAVWLLGQAEAKRLEAVRESADRQAAYERAVHQASMARDVHDVVGHALSVISAEAEVSRSLPGVGEAELRESLGDIEQRARGALEEVQALVRALRDGEPDAGRAMPIQQLVTAARVSGLEVDTQLDETSLPEAASRVLSRVVQEALSNVVRHASAERCEVAVWHENETVRVRVDDDGVGLSARYKPGMGLTGMRERVGALGGSVTVTNRLEGGTRLLATLPVGEGG
jgi:signal transduction histidine kinase